MHTVYTEEEDPRRPYKAEQLSLDLQAKISLRAALK